MHNRDFLFDFLGCRDKALSRLKHDVCYAYTGLFKNRYKQEAQQSNVVQCFLTGWMVHPRVNEIFTRVTAKEGWMKLQFRIFCIL